MEGEIFLQDYIGITARDENTRTEDVCLEPCTNWPMLQQISVGKGEIGKNSDKEQDYPQDNSFLCEYFHSSPCLGEEFYQRI